MYVKQLKELLDNSNDDEDVVFGLFVTTINGWDHVPINIAGIDNSTFPNTATIRLVPHAIDGEGYTRICDKDNYATAYDYFQVNADKKVAASLNYEKFVEEFQKGYGKSEYLDIARLINQYNGIWYDEAYHRYNELLNM